MRLLNLDVDDMYIRSKQGKININNRQKDVLTILMGTPLCQNISNTILLTSEYGLNIVGNKDLLRSKYSLKQLEESNIPVIYDELEKTGGYNLLFTGIYDKSCMFLMGSTGIRFSSTNDLNKIRVVSGGVLPLIQGGHYINMALLVPPELQYTIDSLTFSCKTGKQVIPMRGMNISIEDIVKNVGVFKTHIKL